MTCRRSGRLCARRPRMITGSRRSWRGLYRVMHSACRRWRSEDHVSDQKASFSQDVAQGRGRLRRTAVARCDDPGRHRARQDRRRTEAAGGLLLYSPRRGHVEHEAWEGHGSLDPERCRRGFQTQPNSRAAREAQASRDFVLQSREQGQRRLRAQIQPGDLAQRCQARSQSARSQHVRDDRPDHCRAHRSGDSAAVDGGLLGG